MEITEQEYQSGLRADSHNDRLIEKRARALGEDRPGQQHANETEEWWRLESARRVAEESKRNRIRRLFYHRRQESLHRGLADEHRARAERLIEDDELEKGAA